LLANFNRLSLPVRLIKWIPFGETRCFDDSNGTKILHKLLN
jgi:hypothetical protein